MNLVCGTDFSPRAAHAAHVAAKLARRLGDSMMLVHAIDLAMYSLVPEVSGAVTTFQTTIESELYDALKALTAKIEGPNLQVGCKVSFADPAHALNQEVKSQNARMLVVGANSLRGVPRWLMGSTAEKVLQNANSPVLVVGADSTRLETWATATERRPLQALVPIDRSPGSRAMVRWLAAFREHVPTDITFVHFYEPSDVRERLNMSLDQSASLEFVIKDQLQKDYGEIPGQGTVTWRVQAIADTLEHAFQTEERASNADIIIMGTQQRPFLNRLMHASVSRQALRLMHLPVLCVPNGAP